MVLLICIFCRLQFGKGRTLVKASKPKRHKKSALLVNEYFTHPSLSASSVGHWQEPLLQLHLAVNAYLFPPRSQTDLVEVRDGGNAAKSQQACDLLPVIESLLDRQAFTAPHFCLKLSSLLHAIVLIIE